MPAASIEPMDTLLSCRFTAEQDVGHALLNFTGLQEQVARSSYPVMWVHQLPHRSPQCLVRWSLAVIELRCLSHHFEHRPRSGSFLEQISVMYPFIQDTLLCGRDLGSAREVLRLEFGFFLAIFSLLCPVDSEEGCLCVSWGLLLLTGPQEFYWGGAAPSP
ncbi:hypothetical protein BC629DRAFT_1598053 [Irpex lacteus]|nr:hypothetical protein BC629DRAFT_1598053 [Irpex lacteus]